MGLLILLLIDLVQFDDGNDDNNDENDWKASEDTLPGTNQTKKFITTIITWNKLYFYVATSLTKNGLLIRLRL